MDEMMDVNGGSFSDILGAIVEAFKGAAEAVTSDSFKKAFGGVMKITVGSVGMIASPSAPFRAERSSISIIDGWDMIKEAGGY
ncbi:hypothetical protein [Fusibacter sp. 3D3]|uniref:hypothetical protein n=1 Tax=Fusibacter sp. 3D3 TaxID=1048380 RepID=UPI000853BC33|nr:hypothetical protein [Fusibacter sp. 3D3]GAU76481.1 hypothetical protein F3D3_1078 [Fusibacter sp. 3D3]